MTHKCSVLLIVLCLFTICTQCSQNQYNKKETYLLSTSKKVEVSDSLRRYIILFLDENSCNNKYNSIYFDVVDYCSTIITIKNNFSINSEFGKPLFYTQFDEFIFFIYTGIEKYFIADIEKINTDGIQNNNCEITFWKLIDSTNTFTILKDPEYNLLPFFEVPCSDCSHVPITEFR